MKLNNFSLKIPTKYKQFVLPVLTLIIIIALSFTLGKFEIDNIINTKNNLDQLDENNKSLRAKSEILSSLDQSLLSSEVASAVVAVPTRPSSLPAIATVRYFASQRSLDLSSFNVLEQANLKKSASNSIEINAVITGNRENILNFLEDLKSVAPLIQTSSANIINLADGSSRASLTFLTYWAPLPESIGKTTSIIEALKKDEIDQIKNFEDLQKPLGGTLVPAEPKGKENPFSF